ncbi:hypothetical protein AVT69_gp355 [Pseudomonas phage PhiPA3]|uniref:Uncharacterized protein 357 n=1 Tax=Pseudomonas phage PhiPA3 TaxID=998086 RepID=F8SJI9_BPPA3|nr:hypothetical protein AVT69_gp355 [Pseudomonas phage PhiPA3]AEH03780.1 hypothetical protein [Pseudomonas phage PhiPA3]
MYCSPFREVLVDFFLGKVDLTVVCPAPPSNDGLPPFWSFADANHPIDIMAILDILRRVVGHGDLWFHELVSIGDHVTLVHQPDNRVAALHAIKRCLITALIGEELTFNLPDVQLFWHG